MAGSFKRTTCRLCESSTLDLAVPIRPSPIADRYLPSDRAPREEPLYSLDLFLCRTCGHVQLAEVVDPAILFGDYIYFTSSSGSLVEHFRGYAIKMLARYPHIVGGLAVDIGSNDGTLLSFFKRSGMRVLGIDPARGVAQSAEDRGVETHTDFFTAALARDIRVDRGPAAFISANNVFAHSDSLADMADGVRELLADDGIFVFEVSYLVDILQKKLFDTVYHEHLCYHSVEPLVSFFRAHGLQLVDVERLSNKGGSIRGYVRKAGFSAVPHEAVSECLALERDLKLRDLATYRQFSAELAMAKNELRAHLSELREQGKRIVGYGASATVTTLLYHFEIGEFLECIVDDNQNRHGLVSPGLKLNVRPTQAIYEPKADAVVILAWQYAAPIIKKHQAFLDSGGQMIIPLPTLQILTT